jgi:hypothetical protein
MAAINYEARRKAEAEDAELEMLEAVGITIDLASGTQALNSFRHPCWSLAQCPGHSVFRASPAPFLNYRLLLVGICRGYSPFDGLRQKSWHPS